MFRSDRRPGLGLAIYFALTFVLGLYFTFASIQGDYGLFRRLEADAEATRFMAERDTVRQELARMENLTRRMSDDYLDLDLLDEQARDILGYARADEIVLSLDD